MSKKRTIKLEISPLKVVMANPNPTATRHRDWESALDVLHRGKATFKEASRVFNVPLTSLKERFFASMRQRQKNIGSLVIKRIVNPPKESPRQQPAVPMYAEHRVKQEDTPYYSDYCGLCLNTPPELIPLTDLSAAAIQIKLHMKRIFGDRIDWDGVEQMCIVCQSRLNEFHMFHQMVIDNRRKLEEATYVVETTEPEPAGDVEMFTEESWIEEVPAVSYEVEMPLDESQTSNVYEALDMPIEAIEPIVPQPRSIQFHHMDYYDKLLAEHFRFACPVCSAEFPAFAPYRHHCQKIHEIERPSIRCYQSEVCRADLYGKRDLMRHLKPHRGTQLDPTEMIVQCDFCQQFFRSKINLLWHFKNDHGIVAHACTLCSFSSNSEAAYHRHLEDEHGIELISREKFARPQSVVCDVCGKSLRKYFLKEHMRTVHADLMPSELHICGDCGKSFPSATRRNTHMQMAHRDVGPFFCTMCNKSYSKRNTLNAHIREFHKDSEYPCPICNKVWRKRWKLKEHMNVHGMGETQFPCPHCDQKFNAVSNRSQHIKLYHPVEWQIRQIARSNPKDIIEVEIVTKQEQIEQEVEIE